MPQLKVIYTGTQLATNVTGTVNGDSISMDGAQTFSAQCTVDVNTPAAKLFASTAVDVTANTATVPLHGFSVGLKGQLTTTGGLPGGLATTTDYFIIVVDVNTIKFASSLANSLAGTAIDLTTQGTGNDTFTPTALAGASVKIQKSNDGVDWADEGSSTNIALDGVAFFSKISPEFLYMRIVFTLTAGMLSSSNVIVVKGLN